MNRLVLGAIVLGLLAGPVYAQRSQRPAPAQPEDISKKKETELIDRQYRSTLKNTTDAVAPADPWANMRGNDSKTKK